MTTMKSYSSLIASIVFMLPWVRHLPIISTRWKEIDDGMEKMFTYIRNEISAVSFDPSEESTCYVQEFYKSNKDKRDEQLLACCVDIFTAGMETTTTTMRWAMLFFAKHQRVQDKLRDEIFAQIDKSRIPCMTDKARMPYASAVIHEIQRCANFLPPIPVLFHRTTVDTKIAGYHIPANTLVNGDVYQIMKSDPVFEDPDRFWPERYLENDGVTLKKELVERTIPFGIGKRQCAGEGLARTELFIGLITLVQRFRILPLPGSTIDLEPIFSNFHFPKPHNFQLEKI